MATVFTRIISGELPARFVWSDPRVVAFLTIEPLRPGHTLVVPREEIAHWIDVPPELWTQLSGVAHAVANAVQAAFSPTRVSLQIIGEEVAHTHLHVIPFDTLADLDFAAADTNPAPEALDEARAKICRALRARGHGGEVPS